MNPLNFAVIGTGMLARQIHLPHLASLSEACLHTCCDKDEANLGACAVFQPKKLTRNFAEAISDPEVEALIVATTETFRLPIIEMATRAGKPVYSEKPLADTLENALRIQRLVEDSGIPFCVGHNRRCSPAMRRARDIFTTHQRNPQPCRWRFERPGWDTMDVGANPGAPVIAIRINDDWKSWKSVHLQSELNRKVGLLLSEGTHFADLANWFMDSEPVSVLCVGQGVLNHVIVIRYANGGMATITMASTGSLGYPKELLEAIGSGGVVACDHMLEVRTAGITNIAAVEKFPMLNDRHPDHGMAGGLQGWLEKKRAACEEAERAGNPLQQFAAEPDKGHRRMLQEFIREIHGARGPVCTVADAITATRICLAAAQSYLEERSVALTEIPSTTREQVCSLAAV